MNDRIKRPKLHIIIYSPFPRYSGGRENWLFNILRQLDRLEYSAVVYAYRSDRPLFYSLRALPSVQLVSVASVRSRDILFRFSNILTLRILELFDYFVWFPRAVSRCLARDLHDSDVILAMNPIIDINPALRLRQSGRKFRLVCSVRGQAALELSQKMPWLRSTFYRLEKETLAQADCIVANGYDTQRRLRSAGFESQVIFNGVDVPRFRQPDLNDPALAQMKTWQAEGVKIVGSVATLRPIKGIDELLQSAQRLKAIYSRPFRVVFIGKGDARRYQLKAAGLRLKDETSFLGSQSNVPGFLHYTDVLACVSGGGGMSMACLEGMAAGRAIVAWDTPVYHQLIRHKESGWLVPEGDIAALADAIRALLESEDLSFSLGAAAQGTAHKYDWPQVVRQLISVLYHEAQCGSF